MRNKNLRTVSRSGLPPAVLAWLRSELVASDQTERAVREQALRKCQTELQRTQARLDVLYDDRLDGRIDTTTYDKKATETREQQDRLRQKVRVAEEGVPDLEAHFR